MTVDPKPPQLAINDVKNLLSSPLVQPVLYVQVDDFDRPVDLDVDSAGRVPHYVVALSPQEVWEDVGHSPTDATIAEHLPAWQEQVDGIYWSLTY